VSSTDSAADGVLPSAESVQSGAYKPLSRPLFIYVNRKSLIRPEVQDFARFFLGEGQAQVSKVGYVPLAEADLKASVEALDAATSAK
jgi:phosphate transport system substrate-binding protein